MEKITHHKTDANPLRFTLTNETPDHIGDVVIASGVDLAVFKTNPVALFEHNPSHPVGRWADVAVEGNAIRATLVPATKGTSPRVDEIVSLAEQGILRAVSIGFRTIAAEPFTSAGKSLRKITKSILLEASLVAVPMNPTALAVAKSLGIDPAESLAFRDPANALGDTGDAAVSKPRIDAIRARLKL